MIERIALSAELRLPARRCSVGWLGSSPETPRNNAVVLETHFGRKGASDVEQCLQRNATLTEEIGLARTPYFALVGERFNVEIMLEEKTYFRP